MVLTKRETDSMTYQSHKGQRQIARDDELPGLGVRVHPNDKKPFVLSYRITGRKRRMTTGSYGQYTVDEARKLVRKHLVDIDNRIDPLESRRKDTQGETVKVLCVAYIERHESHTNLHGPRISAV
jgi:hypothetical protein